jgi:hypothetical protein
MIILIGVTVSKIVLLWQVVETDITLQLKVDVESLKLVWKSARLSHKVAVSKFQVALSLRVSCTIIGGSLPHTRSGAGATPGKNTVPAPTVRFLAGELVPVPAGNRHKWH